MLITLVVSLSVHVFMLQVLRIPFPDFDRVALWARLANTALAVFALIVACSAAQPRLGRFSKGAQCIIVFILYAMLKESLRGILMNGVVTRGWGFDLVAGLPSLAYAFALCTLTVSLAPALRSLSARVSGAAVLTGIATFAIRPALGILFAPALKAAAHLDHPEVYAFPYGWQVLIPAYITYAEPVIACMCLAYLIWDSLSPKAGMRILQFCFLILSIRGMLLPTLIYSFYGKAKLPVEMLSESQFLFETVALAVLTAITWHIFRATKPASHPNLRTSHL